MAAPAYPLDTSSHERAELSVRSVNWHVWPHCNYHCRFCFARFNPRGSRKGVLDKEEGLRLISQLVAAGMEKITFVGGEPMLCPWLGDYLQHARSLGCLTMIVSNGSLITEEFLKQYGSAIDWVGLSLDSGNESTEHALGRGDGKHLSNLVAVARLIHQHGIRLKVNVTVTRLALGDDLHGLLEELDPDRLKFLQVLPIDGQNDGLLDDLEVTREEFYGFVERHGYLSPIAEDNDMMVGSYVMIDPIGRFFQNTGGSYIYSDSIQDVGVWEALRQVGFSWNKLVNRGGLYYFTGDGMKLTAKAYGERRMEG